MEKLTPAERKILLATYLLPGRRRQILVSRGAGSVPLVVIIGGEHLAGEPAVDALSSLYSRGLVHQDRLNHFVLTHAGRQIARGLRQPVN